MDTFLAAVKLDDFFEEDNSVIQGVHLLGASHDLDMWYPYLWMLGGEILQLREGHPTKGVYWFPSYNSSEGIRGMDFLKRQVDAGIKPQDRPYLDTAFVNKNFSVMLAGSWMPGRISNRILANVGAGSWIYPHVSRYLTKQSKPQL